MRNWTDYETATAYLATLDLSQPVRRWGWEIESPQIARVCQWASYSQKSGLEFVHDGSVSADDCDCECSECCHSCDCEFCDRSDYYDPDHCGTCQTNEVSSAEPMTCGSLNRWADFLARLEAVWVDSSDYSEDWGGHIHIEARDLTKRQSVNVAVIAQQLFEVAPDWFTGEPDRYNEPQQRYELEQYARDQRTGQDLGRSRWVSFYNLRGEQQPYKIGDPNDYRKTTIEFRRFRSTPRRELIEFRALVMRAVVDYCQQGKALYWVTRSKNFREMLDTLLG